MLARVSFDLTKKSGRPYSATEGGCDDSTGGGTGSVPGCFHAEGSRSGKCLILWSGLSESNRHLNLGKVPYYHYTKAAQRPSFYSMPASQGQASPTNACLKQNGQPAKMLRKLG